MFLFWKLCKQRVKMSDSSSEEEEILLLYTAYVASRRCSSRRKRLWTREWLQKRKSQGFVEALYPDIATGDFFSHNNFLRMTSEELEELLLIVGPLLQKQTTQMREPIPPKSRLIITLRHLATGESQSSLQYLFVVAQNTISNIITETIEIIYQRLSNKYMKFPEKKEDWLEIANDFHQKWNFVCLGALDGKHCELQSPPNSGSTYFNYKQKNSVVLLAICDAYYRYIYINVGANGRVSDGGIWSRTQLCMSLEAGELNLPDKACLPGSNIIAPFCFIGDDAFPLSHYLMKPFPGVNLSPEQVYFNYRLSRARICIECTFGITANRFQILQKPMKVEPEKAIAIIKSCCVLHNFLRTKLIDGESDRNQHKRIRTETEPVDMGAHWRTLPVDNRENVQARIIRNTLMNYYNNISLN